MSLEDLKDQNILLPEEEWGTHELKTTLPEIPLLVLFLFSVGGWIITYLGGGNWLTWVGTCFFFVSFFGIILLCDRGVKKQRKRTQEEKRES